MSETVLYNFAGDASNPGILVQNGSTLYGNAQNGGTYSKGKIYSISINGSSYTTLYNFGTNANDGVTPTWLVINSTGTTLYGTTLTGGVNNNGTLFSLSTTYPYTYNKLYDFSNNGISGSQPFRLKISGNVLYGTSITNYPALSYGTLYSYTISTSTFAQVYISTTPNTIFQSFDISGTTLYYTTNRFGSPPFNSIIYSIPTSGGSPLTVYNTGSKNPSNLIVSGGRIYGSNQTDQLSTYSGWGIFSVSTSGTGFQQLVTGSTNGPYITNLILSGTTLYASISNSGPDNGSIYSISTTGTNGTTLYSFAGPTTDGSNPLVAISSGVTLYGTTYTGGSLNNGTVFSFYNANTYNFLPVTSDYYNIFTNGQGFFGNNNNGILSSNYVLTASGDINNVGAYYSYSGTALQLPTGSTGARPTNAYTGMLRYNTDTNTLEVYNSLNNWSTITSGTLATLTPASVVNLTANGPFYLNSSLQTVSNAQNGGYTYYYFTTSGINTTGTCTVTSNLNCAFTYLVVAGGGGGGCGTGGGGGAGGYLTSSNTFSASTAYTIQVGAGGAGSTTTTVAGTTGTNSRITGGSILIDASGGGGGASQTTLPLVGGSGGGASFNVPSSSQATPNNGANGTSGQGNAGGQGRNYSVGAASGGGGGAGAVGGNCATNDPGPSGSGGIGLSNNIIGTNLISPNTTTYYAGGGGGGSYNAGGDTAGTGGTGGGGNGGITTSGTAATLNTGGGGGGGGYSGSAISGSSGANGIIIIRFLSYQ